MPRLLPAVWAECTDNSLNLKTPCFALAKQGVYFWNVKIPIQRSKRHLLCIICKQHLFLTSNIHIRHCLSSRHLRKSVINRYQAKVSEDIANDIKKILYLFKFHTYRAAFLVFLTGFASLIYFGDG